MRNLIKKILKESDDLDWIRDIEVETDLTPAELKMRYDNIPFGVFSKYIAGQFRDIYLEGGKLFLYLKDFSEFVDLFKEDRGGDGYVNRYLAKLILAEDDFWEPYYDFVDWLNDVWDMVTNDEELLQYIKEYIKKNYVVPKNYNPDQLDVFGNKPKKLNINNIDGRILDVDFFNEIIQDNDYLGELIETEPMFEDLKLELKWAYESAYNTAARDEVYLSTVGSIRDIFGDGEWTSFENIRGHTENMLKFDVTNLIIEVVENSIDNCLEECRKYFDVSKHYEVDEHGSEEEAFEEFCEECVDHPFDNFGDFISFYSDLLDNSNDLLNPRYDEYPNDSVIVKYFPEDVYSRI